MNGYPVSHQFVRCASVTSSNPSHVRHVRPLCSSTAPVLFVKARTQKNKWPKQVKFPVQSNTPRKANPGPASIAKARLGADTPKAASLASRAPKNEECVLIVFQTLCASCAKRKSPIKRVGSMQTESASIVSRPLNSWRLCPPSLRGYAKNLEHQTNKLATVFQKWKHPTQPGTPRIGPLGLASTVERWNGASV